MPYSIRLLILLFVASGPLLGDEPKNAIRRPPPAKLNFVSSKKLEDGRRELEFDLSIEKNIVIWARQDPKGPYETLSPKIVLKPSDGVTVPIEIIYPTPEHYFVDPPDEANVSTIKSYYYTDNVKFRVRYIPLENQDPLRITCIFGALNKERSYCLGRRKFEADIPSQE